MTNWKTTYNLRTKVLNVGQKLIVPAESTSILMLKKKC